MITDARAKELIDLGNKLFLAKGPLDTLCQELAENCYPERADFTVVRNLGEDFAAHLNDSYPSLARRELCNSFSAILRPRDKHWFQSTTYDERIDNDPGNARYLEYLTGEVRTGIYDPRTQFIAATKMADHDFGTFGNAVVSVEESPNRRHLFFRPHHFRDCAWLENDIGVVDHLHRKDRMTARAMKRRFGEKNLHETVKKACEENPGQEFNLRVVVMPADEYDYIVKDKTAGGARRKGRKLPFVIVYVDADNCKVIREGGLPDFLYMVARWHRIPGFQYAFSPAAMTALPDARMAQDLALLILEAGEKSVYPPMLARNEAVQQANIQAGSLTWADLEADQKLAEAMASLPIQADMKVGFAMRQDLREMITRAWFLDKLKLPDSGTQRTAYEIARVIEDHVRNLMPLFEPMEIECNTQILDKSYNALANMKRIDFELMPDALMERDVFWSFKNPMQEASSRILISQFGEVLQLIKAAQEFAGGQLPSPIRLMSALEDAIRGTSAPAAWRKTEEEKEADQAALDQRKMLAGAAQEIAAAAEVAGKVGEGAVKLQQAGMLPAPAGQAGAQRPGQAQQPAGFLPAPVLNKRTVATSLPPLDPAAIAA
jgi:hypothetical protein